MKLRYYEDTDTLVIVLSVKPSVESAEIGENVGPDMDAATYFPAGPTCRGKGRVAATRP